MNSFELSKPEKKLARQIIEKGIEKAYISGIKKLGKIIDNWKKNPIDHKVAYMKLYKTLTNHDKHISRRYDRLTGSNYLYIIAGQLKDGITSLEEINDFNEKTKTKLLLLSGLNN